MSCLGNHFYLNQCDSSTLFVDISDIYDFVDDTFYLNNEVNIKVAFESLAPKVSKHLNSPQFCAIIIK